MTRSLQDVEAAFFETVVKLLAERPDEWSGGNHAWSSWRHKGTGIRIRPEWMSLQQIETTHPEGVKLTWRQGRRLRREFRKMLRHRADQKKLNALLSISSSLPGAAI